MQLTLPTAKFYNKNIKAKEDLLNIDNNLLAGTKYLADLFRKYPSASMYDIAQMYNIGETKFRHNLRNPAYSNKVMQRYERIKNG
jgi:soluble lytic murein transglycosylase-like protein